MGRNPMLRPATLTGAACQPLIPHVSTNLYQYNMTFYPHGEMLIKCVVAQGDSQKASL